MQSTFSVGCCLFLFCGWNIDENGVGGAGDVDDVKVHRLLILAICTQWRSCYCVARCYVEFEVRESVLFPSLFPLFSPFPSPSSHCLPFSPFFEILWDAFDGLSRLSFLLTFLTFFWSCLMDFEILVWDSYWLFRSFQKEIHLGTRWRCFVCLMELPIDLKMLWGFWIFCWESELFLGSICISWIKKKKLKDSWDVLRFFDN